MINVNEFDKKQLLFVFLQQGEKISFSNDNIIVKGADGSIKHQSTCYRLFALFIIGHITITTPLIQRAHKFKFIIYFMSTSMRIYDMVGGKMDGNVVLRRIQYSYDSLDIAQHITLNKIRNQRYLLLKERDKSESLKLAIQSIDNYIDAIISNECDLSQLLGYEGSAAKVYFKNYFSNMNWQGRKPRIKADFINSTLDIGYTILFNFIDALLNNYGFDTYCGVLHRQFYMRKSLVCDIIEPFRILIDKQVKRSIALDQFREEHFTEVNRRYLLKLDQNSKYVNILMQPILQNKREIFIYVQSYYRAFMKQVPIDKYPMFLLDKR